MQTGFLPRNDDNLIVSSSLTTPMFFPEASVLSVSLGSSKSGASSPTLTFGLTAGRFDLGRCAATGSQSNTTRATMENIRTSQVAASRMILLRVRFTADSFMIDKVDRFVHTNHNTFVQTPAPNRTGLKQPSILPHSPYSVQYKTANQQLYCVLFRVSERRKRSFQEDRTGFIACDAAYGFTTILR